MAQGLQCWDAQGRLIFDSTVQTTYVLGTGNTNATNGSLYNAGLVGNENRFWVQITSRPAEEEFIGVSIPVFSASNGHIIWTYPSLRGEYIEGLTRIYNLSFIYGVY